LTHEVASGGAKVADADKIRPLSLAPGVPHTIVIRADGKLVSEQVVTLEPGQEQTLTVPAAAAKDDKPSPGSDRKNTERKPDKDRPRDKPGKDDSRTTTRTDKKDTTKTAADTV